ncbi:MAG: hypothetical protein HC875_39015 [Anaerolineales bacterium]|nr:hypothetical protein [Anaerolineales bacterium]
MDSQQLLVQVMKSPALFYEMFLTKSPKVKQEIQDDILKAKLRYDRVSEQKFQEELKNYTSKETMILTLFIKSGYVPLFVSAENLSKSFIVQA